MDNLTAIATALREAREELADANDAWEMRTPTYSSIDRAERDIQLKSDQCYNDIISGELGKYHGHPTREASELFAGFELLIVTLTDSLKSRDDVLQTFLRWADAYADDYAGRNK